MDKYWYDASNKIELNYYYNIIIKKQNTYTCNCFVLLHIMTSSTRVIAICACVVLLLSLIVGAALIGHFANEAKEQKAAAQGYTSAIGTVVSIDENTYSCFKQGGCDSCSGGGSYPP